MILKRVLFPLQGLKNQHDNSISSKDGFSNTTDIDVGFYVLLFQIFKLKSIFMKVSILILICIFSSYALSAQGFFNSIPKPKGLANVRKGQALTAVQLDASVMNAFRPVTNIASYIIGDNVKESSIITGVGVGYEHLKYNTETENWRIIWSINALLYGRVALGNESNGKKLMYGLSVGAFDNLLMVGFATDGVNGYGTIGVGIPLNNL